MNEHPAFGCSFVYEMANKGVQAKMGEGQCTVKDGLWADVFFIMKAAVKAALKKYFKFDFKYPMKRLFAALYR